ncbi:DUF4082 domain-containing protein, partial [bacterium]|nr:DUF4082 domain-containing protein [bacterium]
ADEQQRLLANMIGLMNLDNMPLPRLWYFPRDHRAIIIMTGDDHAGGRTRQHFDWMQANSPANCDVEDWECIRGSSYIYTNTPLTLAEAEVYHVNGFELGVHPRPSCANWPDINALRADFTNDLNGWRAKYSTLPTQVSNRTHCIAWSDWVSQPIVQLENGIRLDTNYYYWPGSWVNNRPGMFTGSGIPMRFADTDGTLIDVYQATTQIPDETFNDDATIIRFHAESLINNALGAQGFYGAFTANMHTDRQLNGMQAIVAEALEQGVPVISGRQMLEWLDLRDDSSFDDLEWNTNTLTFSIDTTSRANWLRAMLPTQSGSSTLTALTRGGSSISYTTETIKGVEYAFFDGTAGDYAATYGGSDTTPPTIANRTPAPAATNVPLNTDITVTFSEPMDTATINSTNITLRVDGSGSALPANVTYNAGSNTATLNPDVDLIAGTVYQAQVSTAVTDAAGNALASAATWTFTTLPEETCPCSIWENTPSVGTYFSTDTASYELGFKFRSSENGYITHLRFYWYPGMTGPFVGRVWSSTGTKLAEVPYPTPTGGAGWQEVALPSPLAITANTVYVASYSVGPGGYPFSGGFSGGFFTAGGVTNGPLTALSAGDAQALTGTRNGVLNIAPGGFPNASFGDAHYWSDVVFNQTIADTTPPVISNLNAVAQSDGTAVITWDTNEPADSRVDYGTAVGTLNQNSSSAALVINHTINLTGLIPGTTYYYRRPRRTQSPTARPPASPTSARRLWVRAACPFASCLWVIRSHKVRVLA